MRSRDVLRLATWSALVLGALCSAGLAGYIGGGWKQGVFGYVTWALFPYAALSVPLALGRVYHVGRPVQMFLAWTTVALALGGPLLYVDAMLVRADAQGVLAILIIPIRQTAAALLADAVAVVWQWRIS